MANKGPVSQFMLEHYKHFNAATLVDAAVSYQDQIDTGNKMMVTLAGCGAHVASGFTND